MCYCKYVSLLLCAALLAVVSACGENSLSAPMEQTESTTVSSAQWRDDAVDLSNLVYATEAYDKIDLKDCTFQIQNGLILAYPTDDETSSVQILSLDGTPQGDITFSNHQYNLSAVQVAGEHIYAVFSTPDSTDQGEDQTVSFLLQQYTADGTLVWEKSIPQILAEAETDDAGLYADFFAMEDRILVATLEYIYCLSPDGRVQSVSDGPGQHMDFCSTGTGQLFVACAFTVYGFDLDRNCLGDEIFSLANGERVLSGSPPYDFLLLSNTGLRGVALETKCILDLVSWQDCYLTASVDSVINLEENEYLIAAYETITGDTQLLRLYFLPEDELPQKETIHMAVAAEDGSENWTYALDTQTVYAMNAFNRSNKDYRIEIQTYSSAQDLQLMMTAEIPEIIVFNAAISDPPSPELYAEKGYLADLKQFLQQDSELQENDFLPNIVQAFSSDQNGLWALPSGFYVTTQYAPREYVGQLETWDTTSLYHLMQAIGDEYCVNQYMQPEHALSEFLEHCIDHFVDLSAKTCNFQQTSFYDLLYLCRDYCGAGTELLSSAILDSGLASTLMNGVSFLNEDISFVGYPGAAGNGSAINCPYIFSITKGGKNQDGAWSFLRTVFSLKFQEQNTTLFPINEASFHEKTSFLQSFFAENIDPAEFDAAENIILGAAHCETLRSPITSIVVEEAAAFFHGDKSPEAVADLIESRVEIYLWEQS